MTRRSGNRAHRRQVDAPRCRETGTRNTRAISSSCRSVCPMPSSTFRYTGGNTIRAEISKDRFSDEKKISARMMKDTTGTAHHRHQGAQQVPDPLETGRQRCQHRRQRAGQEKAPRMRREEEGHRLPEGRRARQGQQPPQRLHRRGQQRHPPAGGSRQGQTGPLPHQRPEGRRPQPDRACSPLHLPPPFS